MSKKTRVGFGFTLAILFAFPVEATAGFGIFKRCRPTRTVCCPPPVCQPACQPVATNACEPCAPGTSDACDACDACGPSTAPAAAEFAPSVESRVMSQNWRAVGSGMNNSGNYCQNTTELCYPSQAAAIQALPSGCNYFAYSVYLCPPGSEVKASEPSKVGFVGEKGTWRAYATVLEIKQSGKHKIKLAKHNQTADYAGQAFDNFEPVSDAASERVLNYEVINEDKVDR